MGAPAEIVERLRAKRPQFEVWPANMAIVEAFQSVSTQWRAFAMADGRSHWVGLDYAGVKAGWALAGRVVDAFTWAGVQLMESAAAAALNGAPPERDV
jgi:hypothetical protein